MTDITPNNVLSIQQIKLLTDQQLIERIHQRVAQVRSAFIEIGKLLVIWKVRHGSGSNKILQNELNLPKTTLDNARYTARIWEQFVVGGHLTENQFDKLHWRQVLRLADLAKEGADLNQAVEDTLKRPYITNNSSRNGQAFEDYIAILLQAKYSNYAWVSPGKLKSHEKGLDFIGTYHDEKSGLIRRLGVQVKRHQPNATPSELEWLSFLAGCYLQNVMEAIFITTGRLTSVQLREALEARVQVFSGHDQITKLAAQFELPACPKHEF